VALIKIVEQTPTILFSKILFEKLSIDDSRFPLFELYENGRCIGTPLIYNIQIIIKIIVEILLQN